MRNKIKVLIIFIVLLFCTSVYGVSEVLLGQAGQPIYTLTITGSGAGSGTITSNLYGINCASTAGVESGACSTLIPMGTTVILTATPDAGSMFFNWTGSGCGALGCSILIDGNKTVDANFIIMPQSLSLIAWYRVNEEGGIILINSAPDGVNKLPNLNVVTPGPTFWTQSLGFGYWDGTTTLVSGAWAARFPFPTRAGTIILFAKEAYGLNDGTTHQLFILFNPMYAHNVYRVGALGLQFNYGWGSTASDNYQLKVPIANYYARPFVAAYTHDTVQTSIQRIKYQGGGWISDTNAAQPSGFNHASGVTGVYLGQYTDGTKKWKGILGDMLVWNVNLTDDEVNQVLALLGPRWGL